MSKLSRFYPIDSMPESTPQLAEAVAVFGQTASNFCPKYDYYSCTIFDQNTDTIVQSLLSDLPMCSMRQCIPQKTYRRGFEIYCDQESFCKISEGGTNPGVHVESKSLSHRVVPLIKKWKHQVSRVDACIDVVDPEFFDWCNGELVKTALKNRIRLDQVGDWERGISRTRYLGSRQSMVQICMYEKGYQVGGDPDWVRLEVRVRPSKKYQKLTVAGFDALEVFTYPKWMQKIYHMIGINYEPPQTLWQPKDTQFARYHLIKQYGKIAKELFENIGPEKFESVISKAMKSIEANDLPQKTINILDQVENTRETFLFEGVDFAKPNDEFTLGDDVKKRIAELTESDS